MELNSAVERVAQIKQHLQKTAHPQCGCVPSDGNDINGLMATGLVKEAVSRIKQELAEPYYCGVCNSYSKERHVVDCNWEHDQIVCKTTGMEWKARAGNNLY